MIDLLPCHFDDNENHEKFKIKTNHKIYEWKLAECSANSTQLKNCWPQILHTIALDGVRKMPEWPRLFVDNRNKLLVSGSKSSSRKFIELSLFEMWSDLDFLKWVLNNFSLPAVLPTVFLLAFSTSSRFRSAGGIFLQFSSKCLS